MSEAVSYEVPSTVEAGHKTVAPDNLGMEYINPEWDDMALFNLVAANQDVLVRVGDAVVTVSEAVTAHPGPWTPENEPNLIAFVYELLANQVEESEEAEDEEPEREEPEGEDVPDKEEKAEEQASEPEVEISENKATKQENTDPKDDTKTDTQEALVSSNQHDSERVAANQVEPASETESINVEAAEPEEVQNLEKGELVQSTREPVRLATAASVESNYSPRPSESPSRVSSVHVSIHQTNGLKSDTKAEIEAEPEAPISKTAEIDSGTQPELDVQPAPDHIQIPEVEIAGDTVELEPAHQEIPDIERTTTPEEMFDTPDEPEKNSVLCLQDVDADLETEQVFSPGFDIESSVWEQVEVARTEHPVEISSDIEEIDDTIIQLIERIDAADPEAAEVVNETLDRIIEVAESVDAREGENINTEAEALEEIEQLYIELFDQLNIDYTPELIETLAYLTLRTHLADELKSQKNKEVTEEVPQDTGTHEIIAKVQAGISTIKKAMSNAYVIGRSALRLYHIDYLVE